MNKITAILILSAFMLSTMMASAQQNVSVCGNSSLCDNATLPEALMFVDAYGTIDIMEDQFIDNVTIITKPVTINGNYHFITVAPPAAGDFALVLNASASIKNVSFYMNSTYGNILKIENTNAVSLENIYIEKPHKDGFGIQIWNSSGVVISNYTAKNAGTGIKVDGSRDVVIDGYDIGCTLCGLTGSVHGISTSSCENIIFKNGKVKGYAQAVYTGSNTTIESSIIEDAGLGVYVEKGDSVEGVKVFNSTFRNNSFDVKLNRIKNYELRNNTMSAGIIYPNGSINFVTTISISDITVNNKTYNVASGYKIEADCIGDGNCTVRLYYNKSLMKEMKLDTSTIKVWHETNETTGDGEWLTPKIDEEEGYIEVIVNSFSPFYLVADQLPVSTPSSSSSGSGSSSGSSAGSSGGGAAASPESYSNIAKQESRQGYFYAGKETRYTFSTLNITEVRITPTKSVGEVYVKVEELKGKSNLTKPTPDGEVIQYFNIWAGTSGTSSFIEKAIIHLKYDDVDLLRWDSDTQVWNKLKEIEDGFETVGFSSFAVVKKTINIPSIPETTETQPSSHVAPDQTPKETPGFAVVIAILSLVLAIAYRKTQKN